MPKFEKVNDNTIRIIIEKADEVGIDQVIANKEKIEQEIGRLQHTLKNINDILVEAVSLGITPKPKDASPTDNKVDDLGEPI